MFVHGSRNPLLEQGPNQRLVIVSIQCFDGDFVKAQKARQGATGAIFMASGIAQEHQRFFSRIMQPGGNLGLPQ
ncbi:MAG: hypothetical protein GX772_01365, partial [Alcaligenaceae bacterium]|nr:hypothetical protein [Alcaligenaceae bacterium]